MSDLNTARGPIDSAQLGVTLMHEHIFVLSTEIMQNYPETWGDEEKRIAEAVARLNELSSHGIKSVVDLTVVGNVVNVALHPDQLGNLVGALVIWTLLFLGWKVIRWQMGLRPGRRRR